MEGRGKISCVQTVSVCSAATRRSGFAYPVLGGTVSVSVSERDGASEVISCSTLGERDGLVSEDSDIVSLSIDCNHSARISFEVVESLQGHSARIQEELRIVILTSVAMDAK